MSRVDSPLYFSAFGASTPVGRDMWASAAAARAGVCGFSEHPYMVDTAGEPMRIAPAPWVDIEIEGVERYAELLLPAIDEAMAGWRGVPARIGVALALPPPRPGRAASLAGDLLTRMAHRYPGRFGPARVFEAGHAGGYLALDAAAKDCDAGLIDACMVCAVDSYLDPAGCGATRTAAAASVRRRARRVRASGRDRPGRSRTPSRRGRDPRAGT